MKEEAKRPMPTSRTHFLGLKERFFGFEICGDECEEEEQKIGEVFGGEVREDRVVVAAIWFELSFEVEEE